MEFDEIVVKESPGLCRCCLSEGCYKDLGSEYTWMNDNEVYADMLLECFDISITQHNDGPNGPNRLICEVCITRLRDACNFKKQVLDSEKKFIDMVGRGEFRPKMLIYQAQMKAEDAGVDVPVEDAEVEYLDEEIDYDEPLKEDVTEPSASDITITLPTKNKRGRPRKLTTEKKKKTDTEKKAVTKDEQPGPYEGCTSEKRRKNLTTIFNHTTIMPFKWRGKYICFYCGKNYSEYPEFKKHTKSHGPCTTKDYSLKIVKGKNLEIKLDVSENACDICNEPFNRVDDIIDHLIGKHNLDYDKDVEVPLQEYRLTDFKCLHCEEQFTYFGNLVRHVNTVHPQNCFICDDCGVSFNKKRDLAIHFRNYHRQGGYPCDLCLQNFETQQSMRRHQNNTHFRQCKNCGLKFASLSLLQKHMQREHPQSEGNIKCSHCSKEFHTALGLRQHTSKCKVKMISQILPNTSLSEDNLEPKRKQNLQQIRQNILTILNMSTAVPFKFFSKYSCFYCSKKFVEIDELRYHTSTEHPVCDLKSKCMKKCKGERISVKIDISSLACKICSVPIPDFDSLINHLIAEHTANYDKTITGCLEPYKVVKDNMPCPICPDRVFRYFGILLRHMNSEHSNNNRICDFCGRSFRNASNLNVHINYAHTGSCECDICGVKYKNQWCLARHRARTHDAKDYKCPKCPELFQSQYHKQKHLIKDHDIGHKCSYCGKMFTRNSFMKDHIRRTHLKEKNVPCSVCNEKFFDNYLLRMHMVKHEGDRKFNCSICGKAFLRKSNLSSHMEMHKKYGHVQLPI